MSEHDDDSGGSAAGQDYNARGWNRAHNPKAHLALTSFGSAVVTRGAQGCTITGNTFTGNVSEGIFYSASQAVGTIATNVASYNDFLGTTVGARYGGVETINVKCNWWNHILGPNYPPTNINASGAGIVGADFQYVSWLDGSIAGPPPLCNQPPPVPTRPATWGKVKTLYR